jgi:tetratricopeptide (TPR) repeat protein
MPVVSGDCGFVGSREPTNLHLLLSPLTGDKFMATSDVLEGILIAEPVNVHHEEAARLLEQALQASGNDPQVAYLLAMAHKRLGKVPEARAALRKIARPDGNVLLQMGLLSLQEKQYAQAEQEFARAWQMEPTSYEAGYNLAFTRLVLGQLEPCAALLARVIELAPSADEQRFLRVLQELVASCLPGGRLPGPKADDPLIPVLLEMTPADEQRLLQLLRGMEQFEVAYPMLRTLAAVRPRSPAVLEANFEAALVQGRKLFDRCDWGAASRLLGPLARSISESRNIARPTQVAFFNLLGCCACMEQDFERGVKHFVAALRLAGNDARLHQNLALGYEWQADLEQADPEWNRFLDLLDQRLATPANRPDYVPQLGFEILNHLAEWYSRKERWPAAITYLQRAQKVRPQDPDLLERLFHLFVQVKRTDDARRALARLRQFRPNDPQLELYEIDLHDTKSLDDIDRVLGEIGRILKRFPNDMRVEERAVNMVGNVIPLMSHICDQLTEQMNKISDQVRHLPSYQINWSAVRDVMRDLEDEFLKLRQITRLCLPLVNSDEHRRIIRELSSHIDRKIEDCRRRGRGY